MCDHPLSCVASVNRKEICSSQQTMQKGPLWTSASEVITIHSTSIELIVTRDSKSYTLWIEIEYLCVFLDSSSNDKVIPA